MPNHFINSYVINCKNSELHNFVLNKLNELGFDVTGMEHILVTPLTCIRIDLYYKDTKHGWVATYCNNTVHTFSEFINDFVPKYKEGIREFGI